MQEEIENRRKCERLIEETHGVVERFIKGEAGPDEKVLASYNNYSLWIEFKVSDLEIIAEELDRIFPFTIEYFDIAPPSYLRNQFPFLVVYSSSRTYLKSPPLRQQKPHFHPLFCH